MSPRYTDAYSFSTGAVRTKAILYFLLTSDKLAEEQKPHSIMQVWQPGDNWINIGMQKWAATGLTATRQPLQQMLAVGESGEGLLSGSGDRHEEPVEAPDSVPSKRGTLRTARWIGSHAYVAGMDRQVYRRDNVKQWTSIDQSMRPPAGSKEVVGFESLDGFDENELYAVGWQGVIWRYDGKVWKQEDSPTNLILGGVCCAGDGKVYACGRRGTLLRGRAGAWEVIPHDSTEEDLFGIAWYNGALYVASLHRVYRLNADGTLESIMVGDDPPATSAYSLSAGDGVLLSTGAKDVMLYDGKTWTRIE